MTREEELKKEIEGLESVKYPDFIFEDVTKAKYNLKIVKAELKGIQEERQRILKLIDECVGYSDYDKRFIVISIEELKSKIEIK